MIPLQVFLRFPGSPLLRFNRFLSLLPLVFLLWFAASATAGTGSIRVSWDPEAVRTGAVVALSVESPVSLDRAEAVTGGERFPLLETDDGYVALVGVDLKWPEGLYPVDLVLYPASGGPPYRLRADLKVRDRDFGSQALSLPTGMVDLSEDRLKQVQGDNGSLRRVLTERTRKRYWQGPFTRPVRGRVSTGFGVARTLNGQPRSPHSGTDIAAPRGTPVGTANRGVVTLVQDMYLSGNTVVVDHGWGVSTVYAHLDSVAVKEGQLVRRGQPIGTVGSTGRATGPHLHFGAFIRGAKVDPLGLIEVTSGL